MSNEYATWVEPVAARMRGAGEDALRLSRSLGDDDLARVTEGEGWSVREELAHISASQTDFARVLSQIVRGDAPDTSVFADIDARNARNLEERREWPMTAIAQELEDGGREVQGLLSRLNDADETQTPEGVPFQLGQMLAGYSMHDAYHLDQVNATLGR